MAEQIVTSTTSKPTLDDVVDVKSFEDDEPHRGGRRGRRKVKLDLKCPLCESGVKFVTYKDVYQLKKFTSVRGKIISTEKSGVCAKHQRQLTGSIKRARFMALLPYVAADA
ncbi:30S ribosomal protein S18 [Candidatus Nomurabacteria bacterium]|uniref:Small ribosomal subunit protein bS18 n=1 Tax=Candidatus Dojkabacteria bacterium TaxID=2099670 RepID=A0A955I0C3_9BACT|nr:30S ribosomal protein S18 [Candidatus Dojkabacteria bacterium]MCB9789808.1 30S ribosomal protein S18 [Candidatus Nomurabacteria bacterium]MCB9803568.1 30S ribosomal protein S18 [Candidatus Nomurabacteria bacterium]